MIWFPIWVCDGQSDSWFFNLNSWLAIWSLDSWSEYRVRFEISDLFSGRPIWMSDSWWEPQISDYFIRSTEIWHSDQWWRRKSQFHGGHKTQVFRDIEFKFGTHPLWEILVGKFSWNQICSIFNPLLNPSKNPLWDRSK